MHPHDRHDKQFRQEASGGWPHSNEYQDFPADGFLDFNPDEGGKLFQDKDSCDANNMPAFNSPSVSSALPAKQAPLRGDWPHRSMDQYQTARQF
jgi:hypothetical protein